MGSQYIPDLEMLPQKRDGCKTMFLACRRWVKAEENEKLPVTDVLNCLHHNTHMAINHIYVSTLPFNTVTLVQDTMHC